VKTVVTLITWAELDKAIERRDAKALRRMAKETQNEDARIILNLLAEIIQRQVKKSTHLKKKTRSLKRTA
jgi:Holliday junction resolvasome RuvABC DNA-binding subunit